MKSYAERLFESAVRREFAASQDPQGRMRRCDSYRGAAIRGSTKAQFFLALDYAYGRDHRKNHLLAMAWFKRAARSGEELCELLVKRGENTVERQVRSFAGLLREL